MKLPPSSIEIRRLRRRLLRFYDERRRDLPWRRTRDPYRILVSEVMLQQTTVATVVPYYQRFVQRFPDARALAEAPESEVLTRWSGLGYYRRARNLQQACRTVMESHGGSLPDTYDGLLSLPGVGPYTAGAVASIAFDRAEPVLDGNVHRVLCRLATLPGLGAGDRARLLQAARVLIDPARPGDLNQALMELGATVCTPRRPGCDTCPLARDCRAKGAGTPESWPERRRRPSTVEARGVALVIRERGGIVVVRRPDRPPLAGMWELPGIAGVDGDSPEPTPAAVAAAAHGQLGVAVELRDRLGEVRHGVMNRRVRLEVRRGVLRRGKQCSGAGDLEDAEALPAALRQRRPRSRVRSLEDPDLPALTGASRKILRLGGVLDG